MTETVQDTHRWRADIQILRGIAVCAVILFHSGLGLAPSGYLGVDIFFVVSGYLIGGIVMRDRAANRFAFGMFYLRRIRRLAPAAFVTLGATIIAAAWLTTPSGYARFWPQLTGALTFSSNIVLWRQINYFNDSAQTEALLHFWSLAVEEQFYLLFPLALMLCPKRWWMPAIAAATLASLAAYLILYPRSPGATFYLLPTRGWELGLGVLAAGLDERWRTWTPRARPIAVLTIALIVFAPTFPEAQWLALPACLATMIIVAAPPGRAEQHGLASRLGTAIGDRSYSLYLVHWPLFAFANAVHLSAPLPPMLSVLLVAATFVIGELLFQGVERPVRRRRDRPAVVWSMFAATTLALALTGGWVLHAKRSATPALDLGGVTGLDLPGCDPDAARFDGRCTQSPTPAMLVWGDSFSQALIPALVASSSRPIAQASHGGCAPLPGFAPIDLDASRAVARQCLRFNASVLAYLARTPSIEVVVLSGRYLRYALPATRALHYAADGSEVVTTPDPAAFAATQARTSAAIRAMGKRVVVVSGPPQAAFDVGQCWERTLAGLPLVDQSPGCAIMAANTHPSARWADRLLRDFARDGTPVLWLDAALCHAGRCVTAVDGVPLYRDTGHFSRTGSGLVGRRLQLGKRVWTAAR